MDATLPLTSSADTFDAFRARAAYSAEEWNVYFHALPRPHLMQSWAYGEAKRAAAHMHVQRIVFERDNLPVALCQVLQARVAGCAVGTRINRGPVFLDAQPVYSVREGVMRMVRAHFRIGRGAPLLIAPALEDTEENRALMKGLGFRQRKKRGWVSAAIDLTLSEDELLKRLDGSWRNHLRKSLRNGLELRVANDVETVDWMMERHRENMQAKGFKGPKPALLAALYRAHPEHFKILQALHEGKPVAAMIIARYGRSAEHYVGWFGPAGRKLDSGNFLYWQAVREAKKAGLLWFDVGGYETNDRFGHFKQNMRGVEYRLCGEWVGV